MEWNDLGQYRLKAALHEESNEGWVWISGDGWRSGDPIILSYTGKKTRKVHLICRSIDYNFRGCYDAEMRNRYGADKARSLDPKKSYVLLSKHYRDKLGMEDVIRSAHGIAAQGLAARQPRALKAYSKLRASMMHADPFVRIGTWLAFIGLALAIAALVPMLVEFVQFLFSVFEVAG